MTERDVKDNCSCDINKENSENMERKCRLTKYNYHYGIT